MLLEVKLLWLFAIPWTVAYQAPPPTEFSRQECWSGLPFPSPGDLPNPGIEPRSSALQADALPSELPEKPLTSTLCQSQRWTTKSETGLSSKSSQSQRRVKLANKSQDNVMRAQKWKAENQGWRLQPEMPETHDLGFENSSLGKEVREWGFHGVEAAVPDIGSTRAEQSAAQRGEERRLCIHPGATVGIWSLTSLDKSSRTTTSLHLYEKFRQISKLSCQHHCLHVSLNTKAWKIKSNAWAPLQPNYTGISSFRV